MWHPWPGASLVLYMLLIAVTLGAGVVGSAAAADCGDRIGPCSCGDRVVTNTTLGGSDPVLRTMCPCIGLIVAPGVTLDLGGTLKGSDQSNPLCSGVLIEDGAQDVIVRHGRVMGFFTGVRGENDVTNVSVSGVQALDNTIGILLAGSVIGNLAVRGNVVSGNETYGMFVVGADNIAVQDNRADTNTLGIFVNSGGNLMVSGNAATGNTIRGIEITGFGGTVELNRADLNGGFGFTIDGANLDVRRNVSSRNGRDPASPGDGFVVGGTGIRFDRNRGFYNREYGIRDQSSFQDNVYTDNLCGGNTLGDSSPPGLCH